jgi:hypothetical protein
MPNIMKKMSFEERLVDSSRFRKAYARIPVVVIYKNEKYKKFIIPPDVTIGMFRLILRKKLLLPSSVGTFIYIGGNTLTSSVDVISVLDSQYKDPDGFLYLEARHTRKDLKIVKMYISEIFNESCSLNILELICDYMIPCDELITEIEKIYAYRHTNKYKIITMLEKLSDKIDNLEKKVDAIYNII